jgi:hypothetical protein
MHLKDRRVNHGFLEPIETQYLQDPYLLRLQILLLWVQCLAHCADCHIIGAHTVADHPTKLQDHGLEIVEILVGGLTLDSNSNLRIVMTRSLPIILPVCLPTLVLNSMRYFLSVHIRSSSGGEWIQTMLTDVYGRRFLVDQPSHTKLIFDLIAYEVRLSVRCFDHQRNCAP